MHRKHQPLTKAKIIPYNIKYHLTWGQGRQETQPTKQLVSMGP